jgi:hypothetical protein
MAVLGGFGAFIAALILKNEKGTVVSFRNKKEE